MTEIAFDCETYPLGLVPEDNSKTSRNQAPSPVCLSYYDGEEVGLVKPDEGAELLHQWIDEEEVLIGHNVAFDMVVMCRYDNDLIEKVFNHYSRGLVRDTMVRSQLIDIATCGLNNRHGGYALDRLADYWIDFDYDGLKHGADSWRARYNELDPWPIDRWPKEARQYAKLDAEVTWKVFQEQKEPRKSACGQQIAGENGVVNEKFQVFAAYTLQLMSTWGLSVDYEEAKRLKQKYKSGLEELTGQLEEKGLVVDGTLKDEKKREVMEQAWEETGLAPEEWEYTDTGRISASKHARNRLENEGVEYEEFELIQEYQRLEKYISTYMEPLVEAPPYALCPSYNVLVASGRSSSSKPNIQNFPKRNWGKEIRKAFEPRDGNVYITCDWSTIELRALAQVCLNWGIESEMAKAFQEGRDLHVDMAAAMIGISYEEAMRRYENGDEEVAHKRQVAKVLNYGLPGGMGPETFVQHAGEQGVDITLEESKRLCNLWFNKWVEMDPFFDEISKRQQGRNGIVPIKQHGPNGDAGVWRNRTCHRWSQAANTLFQGLVGDAAKFVLIELAKECYLREESDLYGSRPVAFIHDENLVETPRDRYESAAMRLAELMCEEFKIMTPDIPVEAEVEVGPKWGSDKLMVEEVRVE